MDKIFYEVKDLVNSLKKIQEQSGDYGLNNALVVEDDYTELPALLAVDPALQNYSELPVEKINKLNHDLASPGGSAGELTVYVLKKSQFTQTPLFWSSVYFLKGGDRHAA